MIQNLIPSYTFTVYLAYNPSADHRIALKNLSQQSLLSEKFQEHLSLEAGINRTLIPSITNFGQPTFQASYGSTSSAYTAVTRLAAASNGLS